MRRAPGSSPAAGGSFYPTRNPQAAESSVKEVVEKLRAEGAPQENRMGSLVKAMGWGMLGAFGGSQVGLWSGRRSAQNVVTSSGHEERISKNLALAMRNAATEVSAHSGKAIGSFKLPGMSQADWNATEQEDGDHVEEEEKEEAALAPSEGFYANETVDDQSNERDSEQQPRWPSSSCVRAALLIPRHPTFQLPQRTLPHQARGGTSSGRPSRPLHRRGIPSGTPALVPLCRHRARHRHHHPHRRLTS